MRHSVRKYGKKRAAPRTGRQQAEEEGFFIKSTDYQEELALELMMQGNSFPKFYFKNLFF